MFKSILGKLTDVSTVVAVVVIFLALRKAETSNMFGIAKLTGSAK